MVEYKPSPYFILVITDVKISADRKGWVSFWCQNVGTETVPKLKARYDVLVYRGDAKVCSNAMGQLEDFKPGPRVVIKNMYVGHYSFIPGEKYTVIVTWTWFERDIQVAFAKSFTAEPEVVEGKAVITSVEAPSSFTPDVTFSIVVHLKNEGVGDFIFARLVNKDTGDILKEGRGYIGGAGGAAKFTFSVTLPQKTDFRGKIEAGHET